MPFPNFDYAIIGSGNVAHFLAFKLMEKGLKVKQIYSRNPNTGKELADLANASFESTIQTINAQVIFIAVQDDQIQAVASQLPSSSLLLYTSGSVNLSKLPQQNCGVFYPLQTFSKTNYKESFNGPILLETHDVKMREFCINLCDTLNLSYKFTSSDERKNIHLCAVFLNNFINHIASLGHKEATERAIDYSLFKPLIDKTFNNIQTNDPNLQQSGPARRNDKNIINEHLSMLKGDSKTIYHQITESILLKYGHKL
ncbi:MAG: DUF2520 domain-containing protein [Flavobacteriia bacterium]|nr:DUF2520 domain-containing protein [Flavobacteriia bacterium]